MYNTIYMDERVSMTPAEMNLLTSVDSINELLEHKLREIHEEKCNANGYVRPDSIKLLGRSMGVAENGRFTGNFVYDCKFKCDVLYPTVGLKIGVDVIKVNQMGAYAIYEEAIRVLLPRDFHLGNQAFDALKEGDKVQVVLDRSRFQAKDPFIMAVGHLITDETDMQMPRSESDVLMKEVLDKGITDDETTE
jgi:hypothetical protein